MNQRGSPAAFQRMPPISQTERAKPHRQRTIHRRESASIEATQCRGKMAEKNRWIALIVAVAASILLRVSGTRASG
jgi:hypothetical protein